MWTICLHASINIFKYRELECMYHPCACLMSRIMRGAAFSSTVSNYSGSPMRALVEMAAKLVLGLQLPCFGVAGIDHDAWVYLAWHDMTLL